MRNFASLDQYHDLLMAAWVYANTRSPQDSELMLKLGSRFWDDFPSFLMHMKSAITSGRSKDFIKQGNAKHMYALLYVSILNDLDAAYLDKVGSALLATVPAMQPKRARKLVKPADGVLAAT